MARLFRFGKMRTQLNLDLFNPLNANPVLTQSNDFAVWQVPQQSWKRDLQDQRPVRLLTSDRPSGSRSSGSR